MPASRPTAAQRVAAKIEREERRRAAVRLAIDGVPYEEIAARLGYNSRQAAHKDVRAVLVRAEADTDAAARELRAVQMARLEQMHHDARKIYEEFKTVTAGDPVSGQDGTPVADQRLAALDRVAKASAEFRKLTGLDAPAKTENKTTLDATVGYSVAVAPEELEQL